MTRMDVREKLVELLSEKCMETCKQRKGYVCSVEECKRCKEKCCGFYADHLISNGVTVQEWISVKEHLPQENEPEGTVCELVQVLLVNGDVSTGWCNRRTKLWWHFSYGTSDFIDHDYDHTPVIAWQPLAQPPKGE